MPVLHHGAAVPAPLPALRPPQAHRPILRSLLEDFQASLQGAEEGEIEEQPAAQQQQREGATQPTSAPAGARLELLRVPRDTVSAEGSLLPACACRPALWGAD